MSQKGDSICRGLLVGSTVRVTEGCRCGSIFFVGVGGWELLRKKGLAEVKSRKMENWQMEISSLYKIQTPW